MAASRSGSNTPGRLSTRFAAGGGAGPKLVEMRRRNRYRYENGSQKAYGFAAAIRLISVAA